MKWNDVFNQNWRLNCVTDFATTKGESRNPEKCVFFFLQLGCGSSNSLDRAAESEVVKTSHTAVVVFVTLAYGQVTKNFAKCPTIQTHEAIKTATTKHKKSGKYPATKQTAKRWFVPQIPSYNVSTCPEDNPCKALFSQTSCNGVEISSKKHFRAFSGQWSMGIIYEFYLWTEQCIWQR